MHAGKGRHRHMTSRDEDEVMVDRLAGNEGGSELCGLAAKLNIRRLKGCKVVHLFRMFSKTNSHNRLPSQSLSPHASMYTTTS